MNVGQFESIRSDFQQVIGNGTQPGQWKGRRKQYDISHLHQHFQMIGKRSLVSIQRTFHLRLVETSLHIFRLRFQWILLIVLILITFTTNNTNASRLPALRPCQPPVEPSARPPPRRSDSTSPTYWSSTGPASAAPWETARRTRADCRWSGARSADRPAALSACPGRADRIQYRKATKTNWRTERVPLWRLNGFRISIEGDSFLEERRSIWVVGAYILCNRMHHVIFILQYIYINNGSEENYNVWCICNK